MTITENQPTPPNYFWNNYTLDLGLAFTGCEIEPPLNETEAAAMIGLLNNQPLTERHGLEEEVRYKIRIRAGESSGFPVDERYVILRGTLSALATNQEVLEKEVDRLANLAAEA